MNIENRRIIRRGIQFGPEVSAAEAASGKSAQGRGLLFAAYQSNIVQGFQFLQHSELIVVQVSDGGWLMIFRLGG